MTSQCLGIPERVRTAVSLQEPDQVPVGLLVLAPVFQEFAGITIEIMIAATQRFGRYPLLPFETNLAQAPPAVPRRVMAVLEAASPSADALAHLSAQVANGKVEDVVEAVGRLLKAGQEPRSILLEGLNKGLQSNAHRYYRKRVFMPEMVMASAAFQQGFEVLEPHLDATDEGGSIVIGAVQGNVQESGILLVGAMLRGAGFQVNNLGINVAPQRFLEEALARNAAIVAVGVYTRDRLPVVKEITRLARSEGLRTLVGGRGINREQSSEAGVDAYGEDGYDAIKQATELVRR